MNPIRLFLRKQAFRLVSLGGALRLLSGSQTAFWHCVWYWRYGRWLKDFKNRYSGQDCFLLANGPSLNKVDFEKLGNKHLIGLNKVHFLLERHPVDLTFHVAVNPFVVEQSYEDFKKLGCPTFTSEAAIKDSGKPRHCKDIHLLCTLQRIFPTFAAPDEDPLWEGFTVTYVALQLAHFMGFENVFLVGLDHSFQAKGRPNEEQVLEGDDPSHFDPRYFAGQKWHLPDLDSSELAYAMARFAYEQSGRKIHDATEGGKCEIFDKIGFDLAVEMCRDKKP